MTTLGIVYELGKEAWLFFGSPDVNLIEFLTTTKWQPSIGKFGVLPLVNATLMTSFFAMLIALPLGLSAAIYLSEYASPKRAQYSETDSGNPGRGANRGLRVLCADLYDPAAARRFLATTPCDIYNTLSAGLVMGIMILPLVSSMSEDALSAVPRSLREAAYGLGATRLETAIQVVVPAALSGIIAAFIIGISRAVGETMIVAIAAGSGPNFTFNPFHAAETMTGYIARISGGDSGLRYAGLQQHFRHRPAAVPGYPWS